MEEFGFKKDETPYIIFTCSKCKQYMYVKTTQKIKKCLRCGRHRKVATIINSGEIVNGMTDAVNRVKQRQAEFGLKERGNIPEFRLTGDFKLSGKIKSKTVIVKKNVEIEEDLSLRFKQMLSEISRLHSRFPYYIITLMTEDYNIPNNELKMLFDSYLKRGILLQVEDNLYEMRT